MWWPLFGERLIPPSASKTTIPSAFARASEQASKLEQDTGLKPCYAFFMKVLMNLTDKLLTSRKSKISQIHFENLQSESFFQLVGV